MLSHTYILSVWNCAGQPLKTTIIQLSLLQIWAIHITNKAAYYDHPSPHAVKFDKAKWKSLPDCVPRLFHCIVVLYTYDLRDDCMFTTQ